MLKSLTVPLLLCTPSLAVADTILGLYAGVGQWQAAFRGDVGENQNTESLEALGHDKEPSMVFWANFEHPIPILPNVRFMSSKISSDATSTRALSFRLGGINVEVSDEVATSIDLTHVDGTLYYEVLDNWLTLDLGITARHYSGYVQVSSDLIGNPIGELEGVLPMFYMNARVDLPFTGWHLGAQGNVVRADGDGVQDFLGLIGYEMDFVAVDVGVNLGYRIMSLQVADFDDLYADADVHGVFAELQLHF